MYTHLLVCLLGLAHDLASLREAYTELDQRPRPVKVGRQKNPPPIKAIRQFLKELQQQLQLRQQLQFPPPPRIPSFDDDTLLVSYQEPPANETAKQKIARLTKDMKPQSKGQLPTGWRKLQLDDDHKRAAWTIREHFKVKRDDLEAQIRKLRDDEMELLMQLLSKPQRDLLAERRR